jgi:hypothetical protein
MMAELGLPSLTRLFVEINALVLAVLVVRLFVVRAVKLSTAFAVLTSRRVSPHALDTLRGSRHNGPGEPS